MSQPVTQPRQEPVSPASATSAPDALTAGRPAAAAPPVTLRSKARDQMFRFGMVWVLIALAIVANTQYSGFFDPGNINNLISQVAPVGIVAVGMTFVIIGGGFDLSVGAVFALAGVAYAGLGNHMALPFAFLLTAGIGLAAGAINGLAVTILRVNAFIATLASASLFSGLAYMLSANPIINNASDFSNLGTGKWGGIWIASYVLAGFVAVAAVVLARTTYGRSIYALGGNPEAARLAGMRTSVLRVSTFMITGLCAAVAGMIVASQVGVGQANVGSDITLNSIAIVIIGGTSLMGGEGAMWRTIIGVLIWGTITNLFSSLALSTSAQLLLEGAILLAAVSMDSYARRKRS
ncbi:MAG: ABC transporter permease [Solirubrobacteraceae bacterium]